MLAFCPRYDGHYAFRRGFIGIQAVLLRPEQFLHQVERSGDTVSGFADADA